MIGDAQVRNRGTIGGSLANSDPAADYPAALLGLNGTVITDRRDIAADEYFKGMFETALDADEIVSAVRFPKPARAAYSKFPNPASRYAVVGVMVAETGDGIRVAVTGAGGCAYRASALEDALAEFDELTVVTFQSPITTVSARGFNVPSSARPSAPSSNLRVEKPGPPPGGTRHAPDLRAEVGHDDRRLCHRQPLLSAQGDAGRRR